ncbi:MAG: hypothetical protein LBV00_09765, partial [Propionibacteriaceae bacterium]|nr:hypothetical protein [Propionibacteriaceae bacterium]
CWSAGVLVRGGAGPRGCWSVNGAELPDGGTVRMGGAARRRHCPDEGHCPAKALPGGWSVRGDVTLGRLDDATLGPGYPASGR